MSVSELLLVASALVAPRERPVRDVRVPAALLVKTRMPELSGLAWCHALDRYLVVSDDTGIEGTHSWHAPWVFAMSRDGALDPSPVPVSGIDKVSDVESICPGPDGTFFLCTSHAASRKGRIGPARRMLLHLALDGRRLRVTGRCDLSEAVREGGAQAGSTLAESWPDLDVEGTAYRDGALYVGLKAPLTDRGAARILAVRDPVSRMGIGLASMATDYAEVPLLAPGASPGAATPEGIADLAFLTDGSLVLCGNAPTGGRDDGGGAVWLVRFGPQGFARPRLLRRFPGLKPEGVAASPDGRGVMVVFDTDGGIPKWTTVELP